MGQDIRWLQRYDSFHRACSRIEDLGLLYKVDVIDYNKNIHTPIGEHIDRVGVPFYCRKE